MRHARCGVGGTCPAGAIAWPGLCSGQQAGRRADGRLPPAHERVPVDTALAASQEAVQHSRMSSGL